MVINRNLHAINLNKILKFKNWDVHKKAERISSGLRINRAGDDAAGLAVTEKMTGQINGLRQAERNAEDGISMIQTAEGYLDEGMGMLMRIRTLAVKASSGIHTDDDRVLMQVEVSQLVDEVDRLVSQAHFNKHRLLAGDFARHNMTASMMLHMGPNIYNRERIYIGTMTSRALQLKNPQGTNMADVSSGPSANDTIGIVDAAIHRMNRQRADLGGYFTRFEYAARNLMDSFTSVHGASSLLRDADVAEELVEYTKDQIIVQSGSAQLAQANVAPGVIAKILNNTPIFT